MTRHLQIAGDEATVGPVPVQGSEKFYASTVLAAIANTSYEGEIRNHGDVVNIRTKPTLTINNYTVGQTLAYQRPSSPVVELAINRGKYFNSIVDDVHEVQSDLDLLSMWADDASIVH